MKKTNRFGTGGCYECCECKRKTRSTGRGDNENCGLCVECFERCGVENEIADNGETQELLEQVEYWKQQAIEKGGVL